jgi:drug/metabolite transporter (DMT)-like permease
VVTIPKPAVSLPTRSLDPRLIASLLAVYVIWGTTYVAIRYVVEELPPLLMAGVRFFAAGSVMLAIARRRGAAWPSARDAWRMLPVGALLFVGGSGLVSLAEQTVPSSGAAVVCATMPLWAGVLGVFIGERPTAREWGSLVLGFAGVVVLMRGPSLSGEPLHVALLVLSPILWAWGSLIARNTEDIGGAHAALVGPALQLILGGALLLALSALRGESIAHHVRPEAWLAIGYLVGFGSLIGFTAYMWLLRNARPAVATSYAFVNPVIAILVGTVLFGEPIGWTAVVANAIIIPSVVLAVLSRPTAGAGRQRLRATTSG